MVIFPQRKWRLKSTNMGMCSSAFRITNYKLLWVYGVEIYVYNDACASLDVPKITIFKKVNHHKSCINWAIFHSYVQ
jgi:hypothetical protein